MLGFWSKPVKRLFREAESKFSEYLGKECTEYDTLVQTDGIFIVTVMVYLKNYHDLPSEPRDPVEQTIIKNTDTSCSLLKEEDLNMLPYLDKEFTESELANITKTLTELGFSESNLADFKIAARHIIGAMREISAQINLLVTVG